MTPINALPGWKPLTGLDEKGNRSGRLLGALLTTFDPPDPGLLIEDYLPVWLGLENSYTDDGIDRLRYFAELEDALRWLKGHFAIVSSAGETGTSAEAWIWNYIRRFEVGANGPAVQHAKLWMFHRAATTKGMPETLELVVTSANLTRDGLRGQIQAGWRCVLSLEARSSDIRTKTWGVLAEFLPKLGESAGSGGPKVIEYWTALLRRCACPPGVKFVASVPGTHSATTLARRRSAWGAAGLRACWSNHSKPKIVAMAPTIGRWTSESIRAWSKVAGIETDRISLLWVRESHPWAGRWQLDPSTESALTESGVHWLEVAHPSDAVWASPLSEEHQQTDPRWCHAKIYELREGARRRVLITSANLSRSAWGEPKRDGGLYIGNFELGVLLRVQAAFGNLLWGRSFERATCEIDFEQPCEPSIAWLAAEWDGQNLSVECRTTSGEVLVPLVEVIVARANSGKRVSVAWPSGATVHARVSWALPAGVPVLVGLQTRNGYARQTAVNDVRSVDDDQILCSEFDESRLREELDRLLEEKYGYVPATSSDGTEGNGVTGAPRWGRADYAVPAYVDARRRFQLVDNWWNDLQNSDERARPFILKDGKRILARWREVAKSGSERGIRLAATVAADEIAVRIRRFA